MALVARGFFNRSPTDIKQAEEMFLELERQPGGLAQALGDSGSIPPNVQLERAMCILLLGQLSECLEMLGLDKDPPTGDLALAQFVYENSPNATGSKWWKAMLRAGAEEAESLRMALVKSPDAVNVQNEDRLTSDGQANGIVTGGSAAGQNSGTTASPAVISATTAAEKQESDLGLLPGLCILLTWWLQDVVLPQFRDLQGKTVHLNDYFDAPTVIRQLDSMEKGAPLSLAQAGEAIGGAGMAAFQALRGVLTPGGLRDNAAGSDTTLVQTRAAGRMAAGQADAVVSSPAVLARNRSMREMELRNKESAGKVMGETGAPAGQFMAPTGGMGGGSSARYNFSIDVTEPKSRIWSGKGKMIASAIAVGAGALALAVWGSGKLGGGIQNRQSGQVAGVQQALQAHASSAVVSTPAADRATAVTVEERLAEARHQRMAQQVASSWQAAKAAAMGPLHQSERLETVLEGPILKIWRARATDAQAQNRHWEFISSDIKVEDVSVAADGHKATMEAVIQETATLVDQSTKKTSSYEDKYRVHYDLVRTETGWKIYDGAVLE
eukprot:TRINITY_DN306_c0_g1_i2.p1 TRINITY_DN306_c0_g1~~TRINITY_DN306_c0_g1_i2.p1  ORF type:complete len:624 (+),score=114.71 TRINITY_DN306_c0_g1_i2:213-1874(+)